MAKKKMPAARKPSKESSATRERPVATGEKQTYAFEVTLIGGMMSDEFCEKNPTVSRTIQMRGDQTLEDLHFAIFDAFDREEEHMYEFQFGKRPMAPGPRYSMPAEFGLGFDMGDAPDGYTDETKIDSLGLKKGQKFFYWFDFGDDWWHEIKLAAIDEGTFRGKPKVIKRVGESPPQYFDLDE